MNHFALVPLAIGAFGAVIPAQTLNWKQEKPATSPPVLVRHASAYDASRRRLVVFGQPAGTIAGPSQTWEWDGTTWARVATGGPSARTDHAMVYDAARQRVVLFGGYGKARLNDTWEWDGTSWKDRTPASGNPPARAVHVMAFDTERRRAVLFGGGTGSAGLRDTWEWDGGGWKDCTPTSGSPPTMDGLAMAYDEARQETVLIGNDNTQFVIHTWKWDGKTWTRATPAKSPPRGVSYHATYDPARRRVLMFGPPTWPLLGNTWEWDGQVWAERKPTSQPSFRMDYALAYDAASQQVVLFGGSYCFVTCQDFNDTWTYGPVGFTAYGSGCGDPVVALSPRSDPKIGTSLVLESYQLGDATAAVMALGVSRTQAGPFALPFPLVFFGMPGCWLHQSHNLVWGYPVQGGAGRFSLGIPNDQMLLGLKLHFQSYIAKPKANAAGWLTTNGGEVEILK